MTKKNNTAQNYGRYKRYLIIKLALSTKESELMAECISYVIGIER